MFDKMVLEGWLARGLCPGQGDGVNTVCVEQAVSLSLGYPLTDRPELVKGSCISDIVAQYKRELNDCDWSSPQARATGLRALAYEQLESKGIDEKWFKSKVQELIIRELIPQLFREIFPGNSVLLKCADDCEKEGTPESAAKAAEAAEAAEAARATRVERTAGVIWAAKWAARWASRSGAARTAGAATETRAAEDDYYLLLVADIELRCLREAKTKLGVQA